MRIFSSRDLTGFRAGLGWIPWWQSGIYSPEDHYACEVKIIIRKGIRVRLIYLDVTLP